MLVMVVSKNKERILTGDMTCNYLKSSNHRELKTILTSLNLKQLVSSPTRKAKDSHTQINVICSNEAQNISPVKEIPASLSDHELILSSSKIHNIKFQSKTITCHNYTNYGPKLLGDDLEAANFENEFPATCEN